MSGELRVARGALAWVAAAALPAAGLAAAIRGSSGAISVLLAIGIVFANAAAAALLSTFAGRVGNFGAAFIALPSFAFRMMAVLAALVSLQGKTFVDEPVFAFSFASALTIVLVLEARAFKRTPWLTLTFGPKEQS